MIKNIILIGFMGSGKTTVGKVLAEELNYEFIDTDDLVEQNEGITIPEIFASQGEGYFRKSETLALIEAADHPQCIIATGGGIVTVADNEAILRKGITVYLKASPQQIYENVKDSTSRPLLKEEDVYQGICSMLKDRQGLYQGLADYTVQVDDKTPKEICELILGGIK